MKLEEFYKLREGAIVRHDNGATYRVCECRRQFKMFVPEPPPKILFKRVSGDSMIGPPVRLLAAKCTLVSPQPPKPRSVLERVADGEFQVPAESLGQLSERARIRRIRAREREQLDLNEQFKQALLAEYGVTDHLKADLCYAFACKYGHNGLMFSRSAIVEAFEDLVQLLDR